MVMEVHVYLPSGKSCSIAFSPAWSVRDVKTEAQKQLKCRFLRLAFRGQQLDELNSLSEMGIRDGDSIDAIVQPVNLVSTRGAFAFFVTEGAALTWGSHRNGGDSSQVR